MYADMRIATGHFDRNGKMIYLGSFVEASGTVFEVRYETGHYVLTDGENEQLLNRYEAADLKIIKL